MEPELEVMFDTVVYRNIESPAHVCDEENLCRQQQIMTFTRIAAWLRMRGHEDLAGEADDFVSKIKAFVEVELTNPNGFGTDEAILYNRTYNAVFTKWVEERTVAKEAEAIVASDTPMFTITDGVLYSITDGVLEEVQKYEPY